MSSQALWMDKGQKPKASKDSFTIYEPYYMYYSN